MAKLYDYTHQDPILRNRLKNIYLENSKLDGLANTIFENQNMLSSGGCQYCNNCDACIVRQKMKKIDGGLGTSCGAKLGWATRWEKQGIDPIERFDEIRSGKKRKRKPKAKAKAKRKPAAKKPTVCKKGRGRPKKVAAAGFYGGYDSESDQEDQYYNENVRGGNNTEWQKIVKKVTKEYKGQGLTMKQLMHLAKELYYCGSIQQNTLKRFKLL